ncbi:MAG: proprotein convertase P-domain-containing protein [Phycisphaerales bacterium]|nr:proprotein convertase P-domain-containing protein [Phycisphaerales bacterium]
MQFVVEVNEIIPDGDDFGVPSTLTITDPIVATDLNVFVRIPDHSFISDMRITLEFGGVTRVLWDRACADEDGLLVTFDDEGTDNECEEPMSGFIKPSIFGDGTLIVFEQRPMQGTWTLTVVDEAVPDTGLFASWGLVVTPGQPICVETCIRGDTNCDGAVNNFDIDPFVQALINNSSPTAPAEYLAGGGTQQCWEQRGCWGDINQDGGLTNFDIDPFVACLIVLPPPGQNCP